MKNIIQHIFIIIPVVIFLSGCSADIPPYDESLTWERVPEPKSGGDLSVMKIVYIDDNNDLYAVKNDTLWYSADLGENWIHIESPLGYQYYRDYEIHHDGAIFILDEGILHRTTNRGTSWTQHPIPFTGYLLMNPSGHLFMGIYYDLYRSTDMGTSWHQVNVPRDQYNHIYNVTMANNGDLICFSSPHSFYSTNEGLKWDTIPSPGAVRTYVNSARDIVINGSVTLRSTDLGRNWIDMNFRQGISDVLWAKDSLRIISGSGGVYRWLGGGSWSQVNSGLPEHPNCDEPWCYVTAMKMDTSGIVYANTYKGAYRSKKSISELE